MMAVNARAAGTEFNVRRISSSSVTYQQQSSMWIKWASTSCWQSHTTVLTSKLLLRLCEIPQKSKQRNKSRTTPTLLPHFCTKHWISFYKPKYTQQHTWYNVSLLGWLEESVATGNTTALILTRCCCYDSLISFNVCYLIIIVIVWPQRHSS